MMETVKDFSGRVLGYYDVKTDGSKVVYDYFKRIVGKYDKKSNTTRDFSGRILAYGDVTGALIFRIGG